MSLVFSINDKKQKTVTTKNMDQLFLSIQGSYQDFELALFKNQKILSTVSQTSVKASSVLTSEIETLLKKNDASLDDIKFITVDQGPGAFTSLRVTITVVNAIAFAKKILLVGVDGLEALAHETFLEIKKESFKTIPAILVSMLNAYNKEVYFAIHKIKNNKLELATEKSYKNIDLLLKELSDSYSNEIILFTGNGSELYKEKIQETITEKSVFLKKTISVCSAQNIGLMALKQWNNKENIQTSLYPLYLKSQKFVTKK